MFDSKGISSVPVPASPGKEVIRSAGEFASRPEPAVRNKTPQPEARNDSLQLGSGSTVMAARHQHTGMFLGPRLERIIAQVLGFFYGNRRDTVDEKERDKRRRNDFLNLDLMGERKVEQSHQGGFGGQ